MLYWYVDVPARCISKQTDKSSGGARECRGDGAGERGREERGTETETEQASLFRLSSSGWGSCARNESERKGLCEKEASRMKKKLRFERKNRVMQAVR